MKAVAVYLKLEEQFVKFPPENQIMPCVCCWSFGNHNKFLIEIATFKFSGMETFWKLS